MASSNHFMKLFMLLLGSSFLLSVHRASYMDFITTANYYICDCPSKNQPSSHLRFAKYSYGP